MPSYAKINVQLNLSASVNPETGNNYLADVLDSVRNMFLTCSFTRIGVSGSVTDLSTLPAPTLANTLIAYDVFAFNDSWQATHPLYVRVNYRTGVHRASPCFLVEMGSQINVSGSIISDDKLSGETISAAGSTAVNEGSSSIYASGDGSYISSLLCPTNANTNQVFVCERFYDQFGQPTGSGFHFLTSGYSGEAILRQSATLYGQSPPTAETRTAVVIRPSRVPAIYDGNLVLGMVTPFVGKPMFPSRNLLMGESTTFTSTYQTVNYTMYGTSSVYMNAGNNLSQANNHNVYSNSRWLVRI